MSTLWWGEFNGEDGAHFIDATGAVRLSITAGALVVRDAHNNVVVRMDRRGLLLRGAAS